MKEKNKIQQNNISHFSINLNKFEKILLFFLICTAILFFLPLTIESPFFWGFNFQKFLPFYVNILFFLILLIVFIPYSAKYLAFSVSTIELFFTKNKRIYNILILSVIIGLTFYFLRVKVPTLGDSYVLMNNMYRGFESDFTIKEFLLNYFFLYLIKIFKYLGPKSTVILYTVVSYISGILFIIFLIKISIILTKNRIERFIIVSFTFFSCSSLLFLGYLENYPIIYSLTSIFYFFVLKSFRNNKYFYITLFLLFLLLATHYASIIMIPPVLYLIYKKYGRKKFFIFIGIVGLISIFLYLYLYFSCYQDSLLKIQKDIFNNLMIFRTKKNASTWAYDFFSWVHVSEYLNLLILINPLFIPFLIFFAFQKRNITNFSSEIIFILINIITLCVIAFLVNYPYGVAKDWDIIAAYSLPVNLFIPLVFISSFRKRTSKYYFFIIILTILFVHSFSYFLITANESISIKRAKSLADEKIMPELGRITLYLNISNYYNYLGDLNTEIYYLEEALEKFPKSQRLNSIIADIFFFQLKDDSATERVVKRAYTNGVINQRILQYLGIIEAKKGKYEEAIKYWNEALNKFGENLELLYNIALSYQKFGKYREAIDYYLKVEKINENDASLLINLGNLYFQLKDYTNSNIRYQRFLKIYPSHSMVSEIEKKVYYINSIK